MGGRVGKWGRVVGEGKWGRVVGTVSGGGWLGEGGREGG